jgi:hypothetical protein
VQGQNLIFLLPLPAGLPIAEEQSSPIVLDDFPDTLLTPQTKQVQNIDVTTGNIRNYFTTGKKLNRGPVV